MAHALFLQGEHSAGMEHLGNCFRLLNQRLPEGRRLHAELARGLLTRLVFRPVTPTEKAHSPMVRGVLLEIVRAYRHFGLYSYFYPKARDPTALALLALLRAVRVAEVVGASPELSRAYSLFSTVVALFQRRSLARDYTALAYSVAEAIGDKQALSMALSYGYLHAFSAGRWAEAVPPFERAIELSAELRNENERQVHEHTLTRIRFHQGRLKEALASFERLLAHARTHQTVSYEIWSLVAIGETLFRLGHLDEALARAEETLRLADAVKATDQVSRFQAHGLLAAAWLRKGNIAQASSHLAGVDRAFKGARLSYAPHMGFIGAAEVLLALCDGRETSMDSAIVELRRWLRRLRLEAFCRPILQPWYMVFRSRLDRHLGRSWWAVRRLSRAVMLADHMELAFEAGYARVELARALAPDDAGRAKHLSEACKIYERIGATGELGVARQLGG